MTSFSGLRDSREEELSCGTKKNVNDLAMLRGCPGDKQKLVDKVSTAAIRRMHLLTFHKLAVVSTPLKLPLASLLRWWNHSQACH